MHAIFSKNNSIYLLALLCCIPLFFINIHDYHIWGDDYAQYIREAQNIAAGKPYYLSSYIFNPHNIDYGPPQYPPGWPLMLAPLIKIFGISIRAMQYLNAVLLTIFFVTILAYFKRYTSDTVALCIALVSIYCGFLIDFKQCILSDLPCAVMISLYMLVRRDNRFTLSRVFFLVTLSVLAILIRTQAVLLLAAEGMYAVIATGKEFARSRKLTWDHLRNASMIILPAAVVFFLISRFVFPTPAGSTFGYYTHMAVPIDRHIFRALAEDFTFFIALLGSAFYYPETISVLDPVGIFAMRLCFICTFHGWAMTLRERLTVEDIFFILVFILILIIPVRQGFRLLLPVFPTILYYCYRSLSFLIRDGLKINGKVAAITITIVYLACGAKFIKSSSANHISHTPYDSDAQAAFAYIRKNVNDSDLIIFAKPRALVLYTGKRSMVPAYQLSYGFNDTIFENAAAKYMLSSRDQTYEWDMEYLRRVPPIDTVQINNNFTLYRLR